MTAIASSFYVTYLRREIRHRARQALLVAAGLAVGVGLVVTVSAATTGVGNAESAVLHSLYGLVTDVSVTRPAPNPGVPKNPGTRGAPRGVGYSPGKKPLPVDQVTPAPGLGWLPASAAQRAARLPGVAAVSGGLTLTDTHFIVPALTQIKRDGAPPASAWPVTFTVDGIDAAHQNLGPFGATRLTAGRDLTTSDRDAAVVDSGYATAHGLRTGSVITVAFHHFTVVGIVTQPPASTADAYIPLSQAQLLAKSSPASRYEGMTSTAMVTNLYVAATSASSIPGVQSRLSGLLPGATVSSPADLASQVSGSLNSAASLTRDLGRWLAAGVLLAAFGVASLLTLAAVARRYTELGTLKALGWPGSRLIAQIMGESLITGLAGAAAGLMIGFGGAAVIRALAPRLSATIAQSPGAQPPKDIGINASGSHISYAPGSFHTVTVHMGAPVTGTAIAAATGLALAGALIAGAAASWRASRLQPVIAMAALA